ARLSEGKAHVTDASNASRTLLFDIGRGAWSEEMADLFGVSTANLPQVVDSSGAIAGNVTGIAGDQQSALFGQACLTPGMAKNTYGTGCFMLLNTGAEPVASSHGLVTTIAWRIGGITTYALEGSVFIACAVS